MNLKSTDGSRSENTGSFSIELCPIVDGRAIKLAPRVLIAKAGFRSRSLYIVHISLRDPRQTTDRISDTMMNRSPTDSTPNAADRLHSSADDEAGEHIIIKEREERDRARGREIFPPISKVDSWTRSPSPHVFKTAIASCRSITQTSSRNGTAATEGVIILMLMQRDIAGRYRNAPGAGNVTGFTKRTLSALMKSKTCYQRSMGLQRTGGVHRASPQEIWSGRCAPSSSLSLSLLLPLMANFSSDAHQFSREEREREQRQ